MAQVSKHNGEGGTTDGMYLHRYSGGGVDQFEFAGGDPHDYIGATFAVNARVELTKVVSDRIADGPREILGLRVIDSQPLKFVARSDGSDPNQTSIDDMDESGEGAPSLDYGDYDAPDDEGDAQPPSVHDAPFKVV